MTRRVDVNAFLGPYPFRNVPHPDAEALLSVMNREGIELALVGHLPVAWHRAPHDSNRDLIKLIGKHRGQLSPVPAVNPTWPDWHNELKWCVEQGAAAVRVYSPQWGIPESSSVLAEFSVAAASQGLAVILTTKFEDSRQRHWMDVAGDLSAATVRHIVRSHEDSRVILTAAGRSHIEEIHWSLTPRERARTWYDFSWVWGPPADDLAHLFSTIGAERFLLGTMWPLRLAQSPIANLELLPTGAGEVRLGSAYDAMPLLRENVGGGNSSN